MDKEVLLENLPFSEEAKELASINERFDNEPEEVRQMRAVYATLFDKLIWNKETQIEWGRLFSVAITDLEKSCMCSIKGLYANLD